jgi:hypothetical protein
LRLLLDNNYSRTITNIIAEHAEDERTETTIAQKQCAFLNVVAAGARVPAAARGHCLWAGPFGVAALSSGRAVLPDKRSCNVDWLGMRA